MDVMNHVSWQKQTDEILLSRQAGRVTLLSCIKIIISHQWFIILNEGRIWHRVHGLQSRNITPLPTSNWYSLHLPWSAFLPDHPATTLNRLEITMIASKISSWLMPSSSIFLLRFVLETLRAHKTWNWTKSNLNCRKLLVWPCGNFNVTLLCPEGYTGSATQVTKDMKKQTGIYKWPTRPIAHSLCLRKTP